MNDKQFDIQKFFWQVEYPDQDQAFAVQKEIFNLFKTEILPLIEDVFKEFDREHVVIRMEQIALDLGSIIREDLPHELPYRFQKALREALEKIDMDPNPTESLDYEIEIWQEGKRLSEMFIFYLKQGYFSWADEITWKKIKDKPISHLSLEALTRKMLKDYPEHFPPPANAREAKLFSLGLAYQLSESLFLQVLKDKAPILLHHYQALSKDLPSIFPDLNDQERLVIHRRIKELYLLQSYEADSIEPETFIFRRLFQDEHYWKSFQANTPLGQRIKAKLNKEIEAWWQKTKTPPSPDNFWWKEVDGLVQKQLKKWANKGIDARQLREIGQRIIWLNRAHPLPASAFENALSLEINRVYPTIQLKKIGKKKTRWQEAWKASPSWQEFKKSLRLIQLLDYLYPGSASYIKEIKAQLNQVRSAPTVEDALGQVLWKKRSKLFEPQTFVLDVFSELALDPSSALGRSLLPASSSASTHLSYMGDWDIQTYELKKADWLLMLRKGLLPWPYLITQRKEKAKKVSSKAVQSLLESYPHLLWLINQTYKSKTKALFYPEDWKRLIKKRANLSRRKLAKEIKSILGAKYWKGFLQQGLIDPSFPEKEGLKAFLKENFWYEDQLAPNSIDLEINNLQDFLEDRIYQKDLLIKLIKKNPRELRIFTYALSSPQKARLRSLAPAAFQKVLDAISLELKKQKLEKLKARVPALTNRGRSTLSGRVYVRNAGLVILHPYLNRLFHRLDFIEAKAFKGEEEAYQAVHLLEYLANKNAGNESTNWLVNKILCGLNLKATIPLDIQLPEASRKMADGLLDAIIQNWSILGKTTRDNLRASFLMREAALEEFPDRWLLKIEEKGVDVLLQKLPWTISTIMLPWMKKPLQVEWP